MNAKNNKNAAKAEDSSEFRAMVRRDLERAVDEVIECSLARFHDALVYQLREHFQRSGSPAGNVSHTGHGSGEAGLRQSGEWVGIESLSRLRSVVGGRFQNIKKKWTEAGFPLREHRGDRIKRFAINDSAWIELSSWILKQGYEARLAPENSDFLFELRLISK